MYITKNDRNINFSRKIRRVEHRSVWSQHFLPPSPMSPRNARKSRAYALRMDQTLPTDRRTELSIVASVLELYRKWQKVCRAGAHTFVMQGHSRNIQLAIAEIMQQNQWTPPVEQAVRRIMGDGQLAMLHIESGRQYADRECTQSEASVVPGGEVSPVPPNVECA